MMTERTLAPLLPRQPLPVLKVLRETYCSQDMTDSCIRFLEERAPDLIFAMFQEEGSRAPDYFRKPVAVLDYLVNEASKDIEIPQTPLGQLDLMCELSRRLSVLKNMPTVAVEGHPLAESSEHPLPPLIELEISEDSKKHISQEMVDKLLSMAYQQRPDVWFRIAEERRHIMLLGADYELRQLLRALLIQEYPDFNVFPKRIDTYEQGKGSRALRHLFDEAIRRLKTMCAFVTY